MNMRQHPILHLERKSTFIAVLDITVIIESSIMRIAHTLK